MLLVPGASARKVLKFRSDCPMAQRLIEITFSSYCHRSRESCPVIV
jgi:hypothetical protein